jgi:thioredoxin reductase/ferredoxin
VERVRTGATEDELDLVILGAGVAGMAAALAARKRGLRFLVLEASEPFSTIVNFPKRKPIFTYPKEMQPRGDLKVTADVKEALLEELRAQAEQVDLPVVLGVSAAGLKRSGKGYEVVLAPDGAPRPWRTDRLPDAWKSPLRARNVIIALGRSGNYRRLDVPGEELPKVYNRLHDPAKFAGQQVLVVGGGDSALEAAAALADAGAAVSLSYRGKELTRPKPENTEAVHSRPIDLLLESRVKEIRADEVDLESDSASRTLPNDSVFALIGRDPPLAFFRRSSIPIVGEMTPRRWTALAGFVAFCALMYAWKFGLLASGLHWIGGRDSASLVGTTVNAAKDPSFFYSLAYCVLVVGFGLRRIRRRRTPYVKLQTTVLAAVQVLPLFLLPQILLPWMDANGWMPVWLAQAFFPDQSWWRAYGLILAWPLFFWNLATAEPIWGWLILSFVQTCVLIPWIVIRWGKGAYCGWICSCGALAETLGDAQRHKMWHGPAANRWNLAGQAVLAFAIAGLIWRSLGWALTDGNFFARSFDGLVGGPWRYGVDLFLAGIVGIGLYFWFSGRVWCRFFCPLAALMHVYAKFTRFRIFADKDKCISCNVCTSVCHQGIDVMNYANKGRPMVDVECVRCSACVQECPTGTLSFGRVDATGLPVVLDRLPASPVHLREGVKPERVLGRLLEQRASGKQ